MQGLGEEWTILRLRANRTEIVSNHGIGQLPFATPYYLPKPLDLDPVMPFPTRNIIEGNRPLGRVVEGFEIVNGRVQVWFRGPQSVHQPAGHEFVRSLHGRY